MPQWLRYIVGSSPRVRGTPAPRRRLHNRGGIIPACAGNTRSRPRTPAAVRDHPRVCGEHQPGRDADDAIKGSSPRVRGTQDRHRSGSQDAPGSSPRVRGTRAASNLVRCSCRIIPACAGNTGMSALRVSASRDHPRVCGEHTKKIA